MIRPLLAALLLTGCSQSVVPVTDLRAIKPILMSCKDTVATRQQIVRHNSVLDSLKSGKDVVYGDDCAKPVAGKPPTS